MTPHSDMCWFCGTALEVWPLETKECLINRVETEPIFRKDFMGVRAGVEKAEHRPQKLQGVYSERLCGARLSIKLALTEVDVFTVHFACPPEALSSKVVNFAFGPENMAVSGVLMDKRGGARRRSLLDRRPLGRVHSAFTGHLVGSR